MQAGMYRLAGHHGPGKVTVMGKVIRLPLGELYMELHNRKRLKTLMVIRNISARKLAAEAGWKSHSYMNRLLNGEVNTLAVEPALRIAEYLQVGVDDLFVTRVERPAHHDGASQRTAA